MKNPQYKVAKYPDGSQYVEVDKISSPFIFRINSYEDLWTLNQIHDVLKHQGKFVNLVIPNLLDAQADRRFDYNQSHGLKTVCEFLNKMTQFTKISIFHPHNTEVVEALIDRVSILDNSTFISRVLKHPAILDASENVDRWGKSIKDTLILMSSDAGGFKPLVKLCDKLEWKGEMYSAAKARKYEDGKTKLTQLVDREDFGGKDILIIDDICIGGGTFKGLSKLLKERNCGRLFLAVSHLTIHNLGEDPVTNYFDTVFTTNSKYDDYISVNSWNASRNGEILYNNIDNLKVHKIF